MQAEPFEINVPQEVLDDLGDRLKRTRWPDQVEGVGWDYGTNLDYMKELTNYWQHQYDWRKHEAELNKFAQFKADIDGMGIHFLHERGRGPNPLPVILTHGWPDSFYRFHKIIPMLTDPEKMAAKRKIPSTWWCHRCQGSMIAGAGRLCRYPWSWRQMCLSCWGSS